MWNDDCKNYGILEIHSSTKHLLCVSDGSRIRKSLWTTTGHDHTNFSFLSFSSSPIIECIIWLWELINSETTNSHFRLTDVIPSQQLCPHGKYNTEAFQHTSRLQWAPNTHRHFSYSSLIKYVHLNLNSGRDADHSPPSSCRGREWVGALHPPLRLHRCCGTALWTGIGEILMLRNIRCIVDAK
jgi:hypothetical protein